MKLKKERKKKRTKENERKSIKKEKSKQSKAKPKLYQLSTKINQGNYTSFTYPNHEPLLKFPFFTLGYVIPMSNKAQVWVQRDSQGSNKNKI